MTRAVWRDAQHSMALDQGWECAAVAPGNTTKPSELAHLPLTWVPAHVPGTVASAMRAAGNFSYGQDNFDASDYWFRCPSFQNIAKEFATGSMATCVDSAKLFLHFDGLATLADVYWNDTLLLSSDNMFLAHSVDISTLDRAGQLSIHFKAVNTAVAVRRPRPRWKTRLVENQQLRWIRTTLLGRIPPWSPPVAPVGPFRAIHVKSHNLARLHHADVRAQLNADHSQGHVVAKLALTGLHDTTNIAAELCVGDIIAPLQFSQGADGHVELQGLLTLSTPLLWWPHTHGTPNLYPATVRITTAAGTQELDLGPIGFRTLHVDHTDGAFTVQVNGIPVFCRGACWTPVDMVSLTGLEADLRPTLTLARDAGMNMLRIGGTMVYESDAFYALCDELGIMVWQDFMFANMDYPVEDADFAASIHTEASQFLNRIQTRACVVVLCGNSEIEQQSAMLGLTRELWSNAFFAETLPALCAAIKPDARYWPSSPSGGVLPFQVDHAVSHYYGVGAYLRPLDDARRAGVRFTTECLGFANIPDESTVDELLKHGGQAIHHPLWKARVPRDGGSGWDFEDVRDHYMALLFRVDPMRLRYADMPRYLALARVTTGHMMAQTMSEWRRAASPCQGALIWFLRDLWLGAGWGVIDALGKPKAAYWFAKRAMQPITVFITDEGLNGLEVHMVNERPTDFTGELDLTLYRHGDTQVAHARQPVTLLAHCSLSVRADGLFEHFLDTAYAYRFGPAGHHLAVATLYRESTDEEAAQAQHVAQSFHHPLGLPNTLEHDLGLQARFQGMGNGPDASWQVVLSSQKFAQSVYIDVPGFLPECNYVDMAPGSTLTVQLTAQRNVKKLQGSVQALNAELPCKIAQVTPEPAPPVAPLST